MPIDGHRLTMRGTAGSVVWGWHTAATTKTWTIARSERGVWTLTATLERADARQLRRRPLLFSAPRKGGFWCWPILEMTVGPSSLVANLGPLEY